MPDLRKLLKEDIILLDGATGTNLQMSGMPSGVCPELWILEHEEVLLKLQSAYAEAGSRILYAPTFSGNAIKLEEYGAGDRLYEINRRLTALTRRAAKPDCFVAGNLTMTGRNLAPAGDLDFEALVDCYKEQAEAILAEGVDLFVIETMMSIQETRAAVLAVKETCPLPVFVTMTLEENGRTLYGTDMVTALVTLEALGIDAFGVNCSCGPDRLLPIIRELKEYAAIPLIAKPNAGLPRLQDGKTVFDMPKEEFAAHMKALAEAGASILGGCCGTDPDYIKALKQAVSLLKPKWAMQKKPEGLGRRILTSERGRVEIQLDGPFYIVGERINPTGKKKLQAALLAGSLDLAAEMALDQARQGAAILDINVGMGGIDEKQKMAEMTARITQTVETPLCIDSSSPEVVEYALRRYPGRALVNSVSCEKRKLKELLPAVKKYGAMFILLPLTDEGIPKNREERMTNIQKVLDAAYALGFQKEDIVVDGLAAAVAAEPYAALDTLDTIQQCRKARLATICGLSNISFGLPDRSYVNSAFLSMAISRGLTMAIANPAQELFVRSKFAADLLMGKEQAPIRYVESCSTFSKAEQREQSFVESSSSEMKNAQIRDDVLKGREKQIKEHLSEALALGTSAEELLNHVLIPAINQVGDFFNEQKYFLPQLIISAKTMETGVTVLEPVLKQNRGGAGGPVVVIATVKGDIHDIGKNLVSMMMKNYGIQVVDLGKDVDKDRIIAAAIEHKADIIGLSALMTTTMSYMKEVILAVHELGLDVKVIVGGAAVTKEYAEEIGADGYSRDAVEAVTLVKRLAKKPE